MSFYKQKRMTYFTSWDANAYLCLVSLGLPTDLVREWMKKLKRTHEELQLREAIDYHCDRGKYVDMRDCEMMYFSRGDLTDQVWHFPKAVSNLDSIPVQFYQKYYMYKLLDHLF